jgi:murein DD-endopeptidase MepM/ murein hydrolase activator NlpD
LNYLYRFALAGGIIFSLLSYQRASAAANGFVSKKVQIGDNVITLLRKNGLSERDRARALALAPQLRRLYLQLDVAYLVKKQFAKTEIRMYDPQKDIVFVIRKTPFSLEAKMARAVFTTTTQSVSGRVRGSLMSSLLDSVHSNWVASRFMDAYLMDYNLNRGLDRGAPFSMVVERKYDGPYFIRYGEVVRTSLNVAGRTRTKHFVKFANGGVFISEADMLKNRPFYAPVDYIRIASLFQPHRRHPVTGRIQPHLGVDFELAEGTWVFAARTGTVVRFGKSRAAGNYVVLKHGNGIESAYNHMQAIDRKIRYGLKLNVGDRVGQAGCTGYCTKAHLHFAVKQNGRMVDPLKFLRPYPIFAESALHAKVAATY